MENGQAPATKQDVERLEQRMGERLDQSIGQLRAEMNHQYNDVVERIRDSETRLLKAFYNFAEGNNKRIGELEGNEATIRSRLATIEDRLMQVEKRLNFPPAA